MPDDIRSCTGSEGDGTRVQADGLGEIGNTLIHVTFVTACQATVMVEASIFGVQADCLGAVHDGLVIVTFLKVYSRPCIEGFAPVPASIPGCSG